MFSFSIYAITDAKVVHGVIDFGRRKLRQHKWNKTETLVGGLVEFLLSTVCVIKTRDSHLKALEALEGHLGLLWIKDNNWRHYSAKQWSNKASLKLLNFTNAKVAKILTYINAIDRMSNILMVMFRCLHIPESLKIYLRWIK